MAREHIAYFKLLQARGYFVLWQTPHVRVFHEGRQVTSGSGSGWQGRGLHNLQARVEKFARENGLPPVRPNGQLKGKARKQARKVA